MNLIKHHLWNSRWAHVYRMVFLFVVIVGGLLFISTFVGGTSVEYAQTGTSIRPIVAVSTSTAVTPADVVLDRLAYDKRMNAMAHISLASTTASTTKKSLWPVRTAYPNSGAILPFQRVIAFYGNFYAKGMGILGQNDATTTRIKLLGEVAKWNKADPNTPALPAVDYIAISAQENPGFDKNYRARMPFSEIQKAVDLGRSLHGITFIDIQVGLSDVQAEVPLLKQFLIMPDVHLCIDPEFSMKTGKRPGTVIGTEDAADINFVANYLAGLVRANHLPPKILVVHRFTEDMLTNYKQIKPLPEVQIVMDMDGWGSPEKKLGTYTRIIASQPVQFTGFKLFYKNDLFAPSKRMMSPEEVIALTPAPMYIQYQ